MPKYVNFKEAFDFVKKSELANRNPEMLTLMREVADSHAQEISKGKIRIIENHPGSTCPLAIFLNEEGMVQCAPMDPLAISFYEYSPGSDEDAKRREMNPLLHKDLEIRGPLKLVDKVVDSVKEISRAQLISLQMLIGNDSGWWPVTDYSEAVLMDVFGSLELNLIFFHEVPIGIAHLDYALFAEKKAVKIAFIGIDPALQGKGLGREILHEVMNRGAEKIYLDTVSHRDVRTPSSVAQVEQGKPQRTAQDVYLKAGFKLIGVKLIDPANKKQLQEEGLTINQLNGPLDYRMQDLKPLRAAVDEYFGVAESKRKTLSKLLGY